MRVLKKINNRNRSWLSLFSTSLFVLLFGISSCITKGEKDIYAGYPLPDTRVEELVYRPYKSTFSLWSPEADEVRLLLYSSPVEGHADRMISMEFEPATGVWSVDVDENLAGSYYTFNVKLEGKWLGDTPGIQAKAVGLNGVRGIVLDMSETNPEGWDRDQLPPFDSYSDAVVYQIHHRDFSISSTSGVEAERRGKYLALATDSTTNTYNHFTGLSHLKELGVTHIRLMPSFDFYSIDEAWLDEEVYSWGYDPVNYNVPEGSYALDPENPISRIKEFKEMVLALHEAGLRVVLDVSYAYNRNSKLSYFDRVVPGYFYRQDRAGEYLMTENSTYQIATERPFVQGFIVNSLLHWIEEYHVDGFYFDELALYDEETIRKIENDLKVAKPSVLLLGGSTPIPPQKEMPNIKGIAQLTPTFAFGLRSNPNDSIAESFLLGEGSWGPTVKLGLSGGVLAEDYVKDSVPEGISYIYDSPAEALNFLSIHNGLSFTDYLKKEALQLSYNNEVMRLSKLGFTALLTSQGIPMINAGEEFMRTKSGSYHSEALGDSINRINWDQKSVNIDHFNYVKGLVRLRSNHPAFRMKYGNQLTQNFEFITGTPPGVIAYRLKNHANGDEWEDIVVIHNGSKQAARILLPEGQYITVCRDGWINETGLNYAYGATFVNPQSASILYRTDKKVYIAPVETEDEVEGDEVEELDIQLDDSIELKLEPAKSVQPTIPSTIELKSNKE